MQGIEVTLKRNKQFVAENTEDYKVVGSENNATTILVHFPEEYENYSKRVDFKNVRNEKWTISLYTPEDNTIHYGEDFDKRSFAFTLPSAVTIKGELKVQFIAYLPDESETFVPFEILKIEVKDDIMYVKKKGSQNPDLILKAYEYSNMALETSKEALENTIKALEIIDNLTVSSNELDCTEHISVNIETDEQSKHKNINFNIPAPKQGISFRARGPWESNVEYITNDFYIDTVSRHGCTFYCKKTNTNEEPVASDDTEFWGLVADKGTSVTIVDNLNSEHSDYVLSAKQGKVLKTEMQKIEDNTTTIANSEGGFSCGSGATNGKGMQFKGFTICDENGKIPAERLFDAIYPVGSIYISTSNTNPGLLFGGTWEAIAQGRTLIGNGTSDKAFTAGATGGESNHTLTTNEMPNHTHTFTGNAVSDAVEFKGIYEARLYVEPQTRSVFTPRGSAISNRVQYTGSGEYPQQKGFDFNYTPTGTNSAAGASLAHNNLPPYLVVYMWKRTE